PLARHRPGLAKRAAAEMSASGARRYRARPGFCNEAVMRPLVAVGAVLALACLSGCESFPFGIPRPVLGEVGDLPLTDQDGREVRRQELAGKLWVASFIFTRCAGPCTKVTQNMARVQNHLGRYDELRFVTFTVDPEYDTPEVLRAYAERFQADPKRWL